MLSWLWVCCRDKKECFYKSSTNRWVVSKVFGHELLDPEHLVERHPELDGHDAEQDEVDRTVEQRHDVHHLPQLKYNIPLGWFEIMGSIPNWNQRRHVGTKHSIRLASKPRYLSDLFKPTLVTQKALWKGINYAGLIKTIHTYKMYNVTYVYPLFTN